MGLGERVRQAIERPVEESEKLLAELGEADAATRLPLLLSGWFRGLGAPIAKSVLLLSLSNGVVPARIAAFVLLRVAVGPVPSKTSARLMTIFTGRPVLRDSRAATGSR